MNDDYEEYDILSEGIQEESQMTFSDIIEYCVYPTLYQAQQHILSCVLTCFVFRCISQLYNVPRDLKHWTSALTGLYIMHFYFNNLIFHIMILFSGLYLLLLLLPISCIKKRGPIISVVSFSFLVMNEVLIDRELWLKIRGAEMLIIMKVISLSFDLDSGSLKEFPSLAEYSGYVLCAGNSVFGPWVSYLEYIKIYENPVWNIKWIQKIITSLLKTIISFLISVCWIDYLFSGSSLNKWWLMYHDALQYRSSHYFVSYLSETTAIISGFGAKSDGSWNIDVAQYQYIEFPRSLVQVVISWNIAMHRWLKYYIFRSSRPLGGFVSVSLTYLVSSLLHGLNYRLAGVLMSLGLYTYIEHSLRAKLSTKLSACVAARACFSPCVHHRYTERRLLVKLFNIFWSALAMFHLAYLGCLMDVHEMRALTFSQSFKKWSDLSFISHWIAFITYILYLLLEIIPECCFRLFTFLIPQ